MKYLIIVFAAVLPVTTIYAAEYECPVKIETTQSLKEKAPEDWTSFREPKENSYFDNITVYDGPPEELVSLVPDNEGKKAAELPVWTFKKEKTKPIWLACSYMKTSEALQKLTDVIRLKHFSISTEQCYRAWLVRFIRFLGDGHAAGESSEKKMRAE